MKSIEKVHITSLQMIYTCTFTVWCVLEPIPDMYMYVYAVQCVLEPVYSSIYLTFTCTYMYT